MAITMTGTTAPDIEFCVRDVSPFLYILASKREGSTIQVTFSGLPSWATTGELLYEGPRTVTAANGQFIDWFGPNEVHIYRFRNPNPLSYTLLFSKDNALPMSPRNPVGKIVKTGLDQAHRYSNILCQLAHAGGIAD